uniref:PiggyBac transposable element-derived protein domain-containing protein n=1 Tax=Pipistrellus kuhlii TaxID=59472 RepID=A0A7J7YXJ9_PIPKU|nr:hypothetical protein mPipKuh1_009947 [Pipistrellus kuhlii]
MVLKWKDKKDVLMLSSIHNDEKTMIEKRGRRQEKPNVVLDYNKNMGGVDLGDGVMMAYTAAHNRVKKIYKKIFLLLICAASMHILYTKKIKILIKDLVCFKKKRKRSFGSITLFDSVEKLIDNNIVKTHPKTSTSSSTSKTITLS